MKISRSHAAVSMAMLAAHAVLPSTATAAPLLGSALASFAVLGAAGVTNVPSSTIGGNLGSAPNASIGGGYVFTSGSAQSNTALAQQAQIDLDNAILAVTAGPADFTVAAGHGNLDAFQAANGGSFAPGTYDVGAGISNVLSDLILDGGGNLNAVWRFRFSSTFIMSENSNVSVIGVGDGSSVGIYWFAESAATLDGDTLVGNVLARQTISSNGGLTLGCGRVASAEAQVTLIMDTISLGCGSAGETGFGSGGFDQGADVGTGGTVAGANGVPEPSTLLLVGLALAGAFWPRSRTRVWPAWAGSSAAAVPV